MLAILPVGLRAQNQVAGVEEIDSTSFDAIRFRARENLAMFMDYYTFISDRRHNMTEKRYYIQEATKLFLPDKGVVLCSVVSPKANIARKSELSVESFWREQLVDCIPELLIYPAMNFVVHISKMISLIIK